MRTHSLLFRSVATALACALVFGPAGTPRAFAQAEATADAPDPPTRVARIARINGTVSYHGPGQTEWAPATLNFPVTSGGGMWTEPQAGAEVEIAGARAVMDQSTEFDVDQLDDHNLSASVARGSVFFAANDVPQGDSITLRTPRGTVTIAQPGQYQISAGDTDNPTVITVVSGEAQIAGPGVALTVGPRQSAQLTGNDPFQGNVGAQVDSPFLAANLGQPPSRTMPTGNFAPPPVVQQMTGGEALADTGRWDSTPEYGQVWYPPVAQDWVPYRHGRWADVPPWGWTWVDDAPWGFAPFHYGRWVHIGPSWGWTPLVPGVQIGIGYRPVYAPALVSFVGIGVGVGLAVGFGRSVGWLPLGPREPYFPPFRASPRYVRNVNITNVTNVTNITNINRNAPRGGFMNRGATTVVPASTLAGAQPVARHVQPVPASALAQIQPARSPVVQPVTTARLPDAARPRGPAMPLPGAAARPITPQTATPGATQPGGIRPSAIPGAPAPGVQTGAVPQPGIRPGAPGPTIQPRPTGPGAAPRPLPVPNVVTSVPRLNTPNPQVATPGAVGPAPGSPAAGPAIPQPRGNAAIPIPHPNTATPTIPGSGPAPGVVTQRPALPTVQPPHATPTPQVAQPIQPRPATPVQPRIAPAPQVVMPTPRPVAPAPAPHFAAPAPAPRVAAPAPTPHFAAPAPAPHFAAPAPAPHVAAPPPPRPAPPAPAPHPAAKSCPPGRPAC